MSNPNPHTHPHPVQAMFDNCNDQTAFKQNLRDFLVQLKEFGDSSELYADERQVSHASKSATSRLPLSHLAAEVLACSTASPRPLRVCDLPPLFPLHCLGSLPRAPRLRSSHALLIRVASRLLARLMSVFLAGGP